MGSPGQWQLFADDWQSFTALALGASAITISNPLLLDSTLVPLTTSLESGSVLVGIPEPSTLLILPAGLGLLAVRNRKRRGNHPLNFRGLRSSDSRPS